MIALIALLGSTGCSELGSASESNDAGTGISETATFGPSSPSESDQTPDEIAPRYEAHAVQITVDDSGFVALEEVVWTWRLADEEAVEICGVPLTVLTVESLKLDKDEADVLAAWTFEVTGGDKPPCAIDEPRRLELAIAFPDARLDPALASEDLPGELYSFTVQRDASGITTLHGVATTPGLLVGDEQIVKEGPLPPATYDLEPLLYLDLP